MFYILFRHKCIFSTYFITSTYYFSHIIQTRLLKFDWYVYTYRGSNARRVTYNIMNFTNYLIFEQMSGCNVRFMDFYHKFLAYCEKKYLHFESFMVLNIILDVTCKSLQQLFQFNVFHTTFSV